MLYYIILYDIIMLSEATCAGAADLNPGAAWPGVGNYMFVYLCVCQLQSYMSIYVYYAMHEQ